MGADPNHVERLERVRDALRTPLQEAIEVRTSIEQELRRDALPPAREIALKARRRHILGLELQLEAWLDKLQALIEQPS